MRFVDLGDGEHLLLRQLREVKGDGLSIAVVRDDLVVAIQHLVRRHVLPFLIDLQLVDVLLGRVLAVGQELAGVSSEDVLHRSRLVRQVELGSRGFVLL